MHAFEDIAGLYREELRSLREDAVRFAVRNPGMARQLGLASDTQPDPLVNLLLESFAWLAARVRADAESRLPLVSHSLLGLLYPQFVCPIPSVGVAEFIPNPAGVAGLPDGFGIPAHTPIHNRDERGGVLRWRTARPLTLHPAKVVRASIIPPASWMPAAAQGVPGVLCLRIEGIAGLSLAKFGLPSLSLHLGGDRFATFPMHEWVHGACKDVFLADDAGAAKPRALSLGREALCHAGLEPGGRLFPESAYALPGYQLLQEYFAYPEHLLFWEVFGLERRRELGDLPGFDLLFPVDAPPPKTVSSRLFRTCAVPVVNCSSAWRNPSGWITSARDTCSCRICGTGTVRK
ncbi:MAG: type VI secretion system baseplate subunit TssF, partial [Bilophila wadsworthia]